MSPFQRRRAALLVASLVLASAPAFAQRGNGRGNDGERRRDGSGERARPNGGSEQRPEEFRGRGWRQNPGAPPMRVEPRREEPERRAEPRREEPRRNRVEPQRRIEPRRVAPPRRLPGYSYRPYVYRPRVVPYGYRPYNYRPGWSVNLYFGRPRVIDGRRYYSGSPAPYGYYAVVPGVIYGSLRIVDAPRDAHVFVDGYYAGVVDDYDGVFQHLNLEPGSHRIEIELDGYPVESFDVYIRPGQTITYRSMLY